MGRKRKSMRLPNYDYSQNGAYFVTICTYNNKNIFCNTVGAGPSAGPKIDTQIILNEIGTMVQSVWNEIPKHYPNLNIDQSAVMPNHFHGIIKISNNNETLGRPRGVSPTLSLSLPDIIHRFKSFTTAKYRHLTGKSEKLWQRSFHDHIIRNKHSLNAIRQYIINNPIKWELDNYHPNNINKEASMRQIHL